MGRFDPARCPVYVEVDHINHIAMKALASIGDGKANSTPDAPTPFLKI